MWKSSAEEFVWTVSRPPWPLTQKVRHYYSVINSYLCKYTKVGIFLTPNLCKYYPLIKPSPSEPSGFRGTATAREGISRATVGFHNFNLRTFNSRVSNPNESIVDVFLTRCRISMCQGLGPNKHHDISEIDRRTFPSRKRQPHTIPLSCLLVKLLCVFIFLLFLFSHFLIFC